MLRGGHQATNTTINGGGSMDVSTDGSATNTTINDGGQMYVSTDGSVTSTIVNIGGFVNLPGRQRHGYNPQ